MEFQIEFYRDSLGESPIEDFFLKLKQTNRVLLAQTLKGIEKLKNRAYHKEPLSKYIEAGLWELRVKAGSNILRILYAFSKGQIIILLHVFIKKKQKTPTSEIEMVRKRLKEIKERESS